MTDNDGGPVVKVARDLREILRLYGELQEQAIADANSRLMPGGAAMHQLGPVANLEAWGNLVDAGEILGRAYASTEDEDPDEAWSAYQTIEFWAESWRRERGDDYDMRRTIATEAGYVRQALEWAWDNEAHWDEFAADIRRARVKLEDVVHDGRRAERSRIVCNQCTSEARLVRIYGEAIDGSEDRWKCPACKHRFDADGVHRAHAKMLHSEGAERWIHLADAIGTLKAQGRPERTIRAWLAEGVGDTFCDPVDHSVWAWWPDLWRKHLTTPTRNRANVG